MPLGRRPPLDDEHRTADDPEPLSGWLGPGDVARWRGDKVRGFELSAGASGPSRRDTLLCVLRCLAHRSPMVGAVVDPNVIVLHLLSSGRDTSKGEVPAVSGLKPSRPGSRPVPSSPDGPLR